ncbi:hypothetical protein NIES4101_53610 [Calothrix sp. NIES-4101]|nr:hypothetical protein NIES4101_53610 [Calothrix sp. NIES-4101]
MASKLVQLVITAKDQATGVLGKIGAAMGGLGKSASGASGSSQSLGDAMFGAITKANIFAFAISKVGEAAALMGQKFEEAKKIEIGDVSAAATFSALTQKSFGESQKFVADFSKEISKIAGALPGATQDYNTVANSIMDNVIPAFQGANKELDQGAFQKNLIDITKKMTLLGVTSGTHAGAVGMFTARLLDGNIASARQLLFADNNPAFMNLLEKEVQKRGKKIDDFKKFTAKERLEIVQAVSGAFIKDEVIDAASNTVEGLIAGIESSILDPKSGVFGLLRDLSEAPGNQTVMSAVAGGIKALQSFFEAIAQVLSALGVPSVDPMLVLYNGINTVTGWIKGAAEITKQIAASIKGAGGGLDGLLKAVQGIDTSQVFAKFEGFANTAMPAIESIFDSLNAATLLTQVDRFFNFVSTAIENLFTNLVNFSGSAMNSSLGNGGEIAGKAMFLGTQIAALFGGILTRTVDFILNLPWANIFITIGNFAIAGIATLLTTVGAFVIGAFNTLVPEVISALWNLVSGTLGRLIQGFGMLLAGFAIAIANAFAGMVESLAAPVVAFTANAITQAQGFFGWIGTSISQMWEGIKQAIFQAIERAKQQVASIVSAPVNAVTSTVSDVGLGIRQTVTDAGNLLSGTPANYNGRIPTAANGLLGAFAAESRNMPPGASPVVANSSEFILRPDQMARLMQGSAAVGAASAGSNISIGNISINGIQNPAQIADAVIAEIEARLGQFQQSVLA